MQHHILIGLLSDIGVDKPILSIVRQYLEIPDRNRTNKGMVAGGALSPLMGALYLTPLDAAMQKFVSKGKIYYVRYMDDIVILSKTRWNLRSAIRSLIKTVHSLGLDLHKRKRFVGRIDKGFDFLGYQIEPGRKLCPSPQSLKRLVHVPAGFMSMEQAVTCSGSMCPDGLDGFGAPGFSKRRR